VLLEIVVLSLRVFRPETISPLMNPLAMIARELLVSLRFCRWTPKKALLCFFNSIAFPESRFFSYRLFSVFPRIFFRFQTERLAEAPAS